MRFVTPDSANKKGHNSARGIPAAFVALLTPTINYTARVFLSMNKQTCCGGIGFGSIGKLIDKPRGKSY
jgi:hypothetical protein